MFRIVLLGLNALSTRRMMALQLADCVTKVSASTASREAFRLRIWLRSSEILVLALSMRP